MTGKGLSQEPRDKGNILVLKKGKLIENEVNKARIKKGGLKYVLEGQKPRRMKNIVLTGNRYLL